MLLPLMIVSDVRKNARREKKAKWWRKWKWKLKTTSNSSLFSAITISCAIFLLTIFLWPPICTYYFHGFFSDSQFQELFQGWLFSPTSYFQSIFLRLVSFLFHEFPTIFLQTFSISFTLLISYYISMTNFSLPSYFSIILSQPFSFPTRASFTAWNVKTVHRGRAANFFGRKWESDKIRRENIMRIWKI